MNVEENGDIVFRNEASELHREDGPAFVSVQKDILIWKWYFENKLHNDAGPTVIVKDKSGRGSKTEWYRFGKLHNSEGPASVDRSCERWFLNGLLHRQDGPAVTVNNFYFTRYEFLQHGKPFRENDGPTNVDVSYENGDEIQNERWFVSENLETSECLEKKKMHRVEGPAYVRKVNDTVVREEWYHNA